MPYLGPSRFKYAPHLTMHFNRTEKFTAGETVVPWTPEGSVYPPVIDPNWIYGLWRMESTSSSGSGYVLDSESTGWGAFVPQSCQVISTHTHPTGLFNNCIQTADSVVISQGDRRLFLDTYPTGGIFPYTGKNLNEMMRTGDSTKITVEFFFKIVSIDNSLTKRINIMCVGSAAWYNANLGRMIINGYVNPATGYVENGKYIVAYKNNVDYGYDGEAGNTIAGNVEIYDFDFGKNINDNAWHHFAFVKYRANKIRLFLDGDLILDETNVVSDTSYTQQLNPPLYICCNQPSPGANVTNQFVSQVDTLRVVTYDIYSRSFTNPVTYGSDLTV